VVVGLGCATTEAALIAAKKATAAIARMIFINSSYYSLKNFCGGVMQPVSCSGCRFGLLVG